jgi:hypothetical protein
LEDKIKANDIPVRDVYLNLTKIIRDENQVGEYIEESFYFHDMANSIQRSNSPLRYDKNLFIKLLYQMFWLTTCSPFVDRKNNKSLEIKFTYFDYSNKPYMLAMAKSIYRRCFQ